MPLSGKTVILVLYNRDTSSFGLLSNGDINNAVGDRLNGVSAVTDENGIAAFEGNRLCL